jgi:hypothetical protein
VSELAALVDENHPGLVDLSTKVWTIEEVKTAKIVASVIEKLYGVRHSVAEMLFENAIHNQDAEGRS